MWIDQYELEDVVAASRDLALDTAENQLMKAVQEGKTAELLFFLKTQGKSRGYVERQSVELSSDANNPLNITINEVVYDASRTARPGSDGGTD